MSIFAIDRFTKLMASALLPENGSVSIIPDILHLTLVHNTGAAFGIMKDFRPFFVIVAILAISFIIIYLWRHERTARAMLFSFGLIAGGTLGNLLDRLKHGFVIDFIDFRFWPVFNIADSAITTGIAILVWLALTGSTRRTD